MGCAPRLGTGNVSDSQCKAGALPRRYPGRKEENWWLVVGEPEANALLAIKRVALQRRQRAKLDFAAPAAPGLHKLTLYFMCDSYLGCDQARTSPLILVFSTTCVHHTCTSCATRPGAGPAASAFCCA